MADVLIDLGAGELPPQPRTRRINVAAGLAVALIVLVGTAGLWYSRQPRVGQGMAAISNAGADMPLKQFPAYVSFLDAEHGYLAMSTCARRRLDRCALDLWATADAGKTWQRRSLPLSTTALLAVNGMVALNRDTLTLDFAPSGPLRRGPAVRWLSWDGGRSWREVSSPPAATVAEVAPGSRLVLALDAPLETRLQVLSLDGTWAWLADGPRDKEFQPSMVLTATDGSLWLKGYQRNQPQVTVWVSRDVGRTWQAVPGRGDDFTTADGRSLFFLHDAMDDSPTLTYSRDGGATWAEMSLPRPDRVPIDERTPGGDVANVATMAAVSGGALVVAKNGLLRRLDPGSTRLVSVAGVGLALAVGQSGPYAIAAGQQSWLSVDGRTWTPIKVG